MTGFDRALTGLALLVPADRRSPESPAYYFDEGVVVSKQSDSLLRFGKPAEAAASAERGPQLFNNSFTHGLAYCTLRLGTARLLSARSRKLRELLVRERYWRLESARHG